MLIRASSRVEWIGVALAMLVVNTASSAQPMPEGFDPRQHMSVDEVQPGMVGFGRTVYSGTKIETFDVEVVSVERGFAPGKSVVWVRCTDERMQKLGPVSGMSGSPIFLWPKGTDPRRADPGQARMIGAFAFGHSLGKDCYAGIQPIQQMLAVASRSTRQPGDTSPSVQSPGQGRLLQAAARASKLGGWTDLQTARLEILLKACRIDLATTDAQVPQHQTSELMQRNTLALPLMVGSASDAKLLAPYFEPMGIRPMAVNTSGAAGLPPKWINPDSVQPQRGGVLSIPLVTGDADMPAVGTITEVLRDPQGNITSILGFGHAFQSEGATDVPLATGYVHFVQPNLSSSFKLGGSLKVVGAIYNDEFAAVTGSTALKHTYRPATVSIIWPDESKNHTYHYQMTSHYYYAPLLAGYTVAMSLAADTELPPYHTLLLESDIKFIGEDQPLRIRAMVPGASSGTPMQEILPYVSTLTDSPFGRMQIERTDSTVRVIEGMLVEQITSATASRTILKPGESVKVAVELTPFRDVPRTLNVDIDLPADLPEGAYAVMVGGAEAYLRATIESRPHLSNVTSQKELLELVHFINSIKPDALYIMVVNTHRQQVAVGRTELPDLPSSRVVMLAQPASTQATPYFKSFEKIVPMSTVIAGQFAFQIEVRHNPEVTP